MVEECCKESAVSLREIPLALAVLDGACEGRLIDGSVREGPLGIGLPSEIEWSTVERSATLSARGPVGGAAANPGGTIGFGAVSGTAV